MTFLVSVSDSYHVLPGISHLKDVSISADRASSGTVLVSANIKTDTLAKFLRESKRRVENRALALTQGRSTFSVTALFC